MHRLRSSEPSWSSSGAVFSIAYRILGESGVAEEVAQDVFLELHRNLPRLASEEHLTAWLRRVAASRDRCLAETGGARSMRRRSIRTAWPCGRWCGISSR